jgi:hypothetical protein
MRMPRIPRCPATLWIWILCVVRENGLPNSDCCDGLFSYTVYFTEVTRIGLGGCMESSATFPELGRLHAASDH